MIYDFRNQVGEVLPSSQPDGSGNGELIIAGAVMYIDLSVSGGPLGLGAVPHSKPWLKVQQLSQDGSGRLSASPLVATADFATLVKELAPMVSSVRMIGSPVLGGVQTTEYELKIDTQRYPSLSGPSPLRMWIVPCI